MFIKYTQETGFLYSSRIITDSVLETRFLAIYIYMEYAVSSFADLNPHFPANSANSANLGRDMSVLSNWRCTEANWRPKPQLFSYIVSGWMGMIKSRSIIPHSPTATPHHSGVTGIDIILTCSFSPRFWHPKFGGIPSQTVANYGENCC